jgi:hypothetical protein
MRWSERDYAAFLARSSTDVSRPPFKLPHNEAGALARGQLPDQGMNGLERQYDAHLWLLRHSGAVLWHKYEGIKLRLAEKTFLTVDFAVLTKDGFLEMHEVKGHWEDDARVKIKVAAAIYPFRFLAVTKAGNGWKVEEF